MSLLWGEIELRASVVDKWDHTVLILGLNLLLKSNRSLKKVYLALMLSHPQDLYQFVSLFPLSLILLQLKLEKSLLNSFKALLMVFSDLFIQIQLPLTQIVLTFSQCVIINHLLSLLEKKLEFSRGLTFIPHNPWNFQEFKHSSLPYHLHSFLISSVRPVKPFRLHLSFHEQMWDLSENANALWFDHKLDLQRLISSSGFLFGLNKLSSELTTPFHVGDYSDFLRFSPLLHVLN